MRRVPAWWPMRALRARKPGSSRESSKSGWWMLAAVTRPSCRLPRWMVRLSFARASALATCAFAAVALLLGALAPARTAPPTVWPATASAPASAGPLPAGWPRRARRRFAMDTPAGDAAMRAIVAAAARDLRAGRDRDTVLDDVRVRYQQAAAVHLEAYDGVVRRTLAAELDRYLDAAGEQHVDLGLLGDLAG